MSDRLDPDRLTDRRDLAAYWHMRLQSGDVTADERERHARWLSADPRNAAQYAAVERLWAVAHTLPDAAVRAIGTPGSAPRRRPHAPPRAVSARRWVLGAALAGLAVALVADPLAWRSAAHYTAAFSTGPGERREVSLPDQSTLVLSADTEIHVAFHADRRQVVLTRGQAWFQVDGTRGVPFIVDAGAGRVRVTGTQFDVQRHDEGFAVAVVEGTVEVSAGPWWRRQVTQLRSGNVAHVGADARVAVQRNGDVERLVAWRDGKLVLRGAPLADALHDVARHTGTSVRVDDPGVARLRVSGIFSLDDVQGFLGSLPRIAPVQVRQDRDGAYVVSAR